MIRAIAIHLPQFHPFPENDEWWGKGFTEWTNVTKAKPLFEGHYQPHLPSDLGYYDLRLEEARLAQEALAKSYGLSGFCYYHYWFNGKRLMEEPLLRKMANPKEDFPFMLCWANENWTRTWDGSDHKVLMKQEYNLEDDALHIKYLIETYFLDERYIRVNGKPVFFIYRSTLFPDMSATISLWRKIAKESYNLELYIGRCETFNSEDESFVVDGGFDVAMEFQPFCNNLFKADYENKAQSRTLIDKINDKLHYKLKIGESSIDKKIKNQGPRILDLEYYVDYLIRNKDSIKKNYKIFPGITPCWDNTARKGERGMVFENSSPMLYEKWLTHIVKTFKPFTKEENFIFINAWNEWAEGNHLEPDAKYGRQYLEATKKVLSNIEKN